MKPARLHRVFPYLEDAKKGEPGHPLYVPATQGSGRVSNPEHYLVLYASDDPSGAVGEAFGNHALWTPALLEGPPLLAGSRRALATYEVEAEVLDLDDPVALVDREIRPSRVVTRDRSVTQAWALDIFREDRWAGVRWWSYHRPEWGSFGMWDVSGYTAVDIEPLEATSEALTEAARLLNRPWRD
ncbi:MAG: RES family NAD+ phosphorylase [Actinomycetota bacterium]